MIDEFTGKKIVSPLDTCLVQNTVAPDKSYAIIAENMITPVAVFICPHCANIWRNENLSFTDVKEMPITIRSAFLQGL